MKIFDILPQGEENAIPGSEIDHLLGITPRERRAQASRELAQGLMTLYTSEPPGGYFRPSTARRAAQRLSASESVKQPGRGRSLKKCALLTLF